MMKALYFFLLINIKNLVYCTILTSRIQNGEYISSNFSTILLHNQICSQCICQAISLNFQALNCYEDNNTCLLINSYLSRSMMYINIKSTFFYLKEQSTQTSTEGILNRNF